MSVVVACRAAVRRGEGAEPVIFRGTSRRCDINCRVTCRGPPAQADDAVERAVEEDRQSVRREGEHLRELRLVLDELPERDLFDLLVG